VAASRRDFLRHSCAGAVAWNVLGLPPGATRAGLAAAEMDSDERAKLAAFALEMARKEGASYADIRINRYRDQFITFRAQTDRATRKPVEVPGVSDSESFGFGIRVLAEGTWGFASSYDVGKDAIARAAAQAVEIAKANAPLRRRPVQLASTPAFRDTYRTVVAVDPFSVPIAQKLDLLRAAAAECLAVKGVFSVMAFLLQRSEDRLFASTEGSLIHQVIYQIGPEFTAQAVEAGRKVKSRTYRPNAVCAGYEAVERAKLVENARRVGEQAVEHLKAPSVSPGVKDLILLPTHLGLTIHESLGHSTELDRARGYEAN
jgi:TldD protein